MKRLIALYTLLLFILASCDSPVSQLGKEPGHSTDDVSTKLSYNPSSTPGDSLRRAVWQQFKNRHGPGWRVTWSKKTGTPLTVFSGTTKPIKGSPEQAAKAFLAQNRSLFSMREDLNDLELLEVDVSNRGVRHVRFQQTYKGIPVYEADFQVHIRPDGRIDMANGHYYPDIEVSTSPAVSESDAQQTVLADLGGQVELKEEQEIETVLMIYREPQDNTFTLAWKVLVPTVAPTPGTWQYFVDAGSGNVLDKLDLAPSVTGDGDIIEDTPDLTPNPVNRNLYRLDGSGYLSGTYANVHNAVNNRAYSSTNSFQYGTGSTHFDEVNVYYHIDLFRHDYLNGIGFAGKNIGSDQDLEAWVHDQVEPDAAHYDPSAHEVAFGINTDFAQRDVVIYHEFIHAAADVENGSHYLDPLTNEEWAIGEGISDYFGGSYENRSEHLNRDMAYPIYSDYSDLPRDQQTGEVDLEEHIGGNFFSAILWELRNAGGITPHHADEIIFGAISRLSGAPDFIGYRDAMMAEDDFIHDGSHKDLIQNTFADFGIGSSTSSPPEVTITGPDQLLVGHGSTWTANASGGTLPYSYQWSVDDSPTGTGSDNFSYTFSSSGNHIISVTVTDGESKTDHDSHAVWVQGPIGNM